MLAPLVNAPSINSLTKQLNPMSFITIDLRTYLSGTRGIRTTVRLRGVIAPTGKHITTWGTLKENR